MNTLKTIAKYFVIFLVIYTVVNWWRSPKLPDTPNLTYQDAQGQTIDVIAQSHQQPILIYFWGTWCSVCRITSPNIQKLHDDGTPVVSVAVSSSSTSALSDYLNVHHYTFVTINDLDGQIFHTWHGQVTPSFVILKNGKTYQSFTGISPLWSLKIRLWLANLS